MELPVTEHLPRKDQQAATYSGYSVVASALRWQAERHPGQPSIHFPASKLPPGATSAHLSHLEFEELTEAYARGFLELGIRKGTRAALIAQPGLDFLALFHALTKIGAVAVLVDQTLPGKTIRACLDLAEPEAFIGPAISNVRRIFWRWARNSCRLAINTGPAVPGVGMGIAELHLKGLQSRLRLPPLSKPEDDAAIVFTSGESGEPKGVIYQHLVLAEQARVFREAFGIAKGETNLTTVAPLALLDPALDAISVVPPFGAGKPNAKQIAELVEALNGFRINNLITSPGVLNCLGDWMEQSQLKLLFLRRIICCGGMLSVHTIRQLENVLHQDSEIHMTYGSVECFPVTSITNLEFDSAMEDLMETGEGICVGRPLGMNRVKVVGATPNRIESLSETAQLPPGMIGEVLVNASTFANRYLAAVDDDSHCITDDEGGTWFRTGDAGSIDGSGRLWYCGRISQGIRTRQEVLYPQQAEALFDQHPDLKRSALVGVGMPGRQIPVLCVELNKKLRPVDVERVHFDLLQLAQAFGLSKSIRTVLFHPGLPVNEFPVPRIERRALERWAEGKMRQQS